MIATQLIDLFILKAYRSPVLVRRLYKEVERLCEAKNIRVILCLPEFHFGPAQRTAYGTAAISFAAGARRHQPWLAAPSTLDVFRPIKALSRDEAVERRAGFGTPLGENGLHWDAAMLFDRISDPTCHGRSHTPHLTCSVHCTREKRAASTMCCCAASSRGRKPRGRLKRHPHIDPRRLPSLEASHLRLRRPQQEPANLPGLALPERLRPPILVQLRDCATETPPRLDRFQLTDSDFV